MPRLKVHNLPRPILAVLLTLAFAAILVSDKPPAGTNGTGCVGAPVRMPRRTSVSSSSSAVDTARVSEIAVLPAGVQLVLHRPAVDSGTPETVTLVGSTNLTTATWEAYFNATFGTGESDIDVTVSRSDLDAHAVSSVAFFGFATTGDADGDELPNWFELFNSHTYVHEADSDRDGMPDAWEWRYGLDPNDDSDAWLDSDGDGVLNQAECVAGTNPLLRDTDDDGLSDRLELGWYEIHGAFTDLAVNETTTYVCPPPVGSVEQGMYSFDLPFAVRLCGRTCTRGVADVNGVVRFLPAGASLTQAVGGAEPISSSALSSDGVSVAAYWDDLRLLGGVSSIRLTDIVLAGRRYAVVEYHTVGIGADASDRLTFRVAVTAECPDEVFVQYVALGDPNEGRHATFGVQGPQARPQLQVSALGPTPVAEGLTFAYHLGPGSDPCFADTDGDGLPDGWEVNGGLAPNCAEGVDGAAGDPDGDQLSNWEEYVYNTLPSTPYTFSPLWNDVEWTSNGYAPPVQDPVPVVVHVGDPSSSHSEKWCLILEEGSEAARRYVIPCSTEGVVAARVVNLERGRRYTGRLEHLGSSRTIPDYDWMVQIDGWPSATVLPAGEVHPAGLRFYENIEKSYVIDNVDGLLGTCNSSFGAYDNSAGKRFTLGTAKTQISQLRICMPCDIPLRAVFSLTDDSTLTADWTIEPVEEGGARLFTTLAGGEGSTSVSGVARVYVSAGSLPRRYTIRARHPTFTALCSTAEFDACRFKVEAMRFNHNEWNSSDDAINLRSNYGEKGFDYEMGEWAQDGAVNFPICYKGGIVPKIQARFSVEPAITTTARFFAQQTMSGEALGGLSDRLVIFSDGFSGWNTFTSLQQIMTIVSCGTNSFDWYLCGIDNNAFVPFMIDWTGPHRVYTILADPVEPWISDPTDQKCGVWTNALDWACRSTIGATTPNDAASYIAEEINAGCGFSYGNSEIDGSDYLYTPLLSERQVFDLTGFFEWRAGRRPEGFWVNCTDCAIMVTTFSNLLGCELYASKIRGDFETNELVIIGDDTWQSWNFIYHEVAWSGLCEEYDLVYDACLRYDGCGDPWAAPREAVLPVDIPFSDGVSGEPYDYRDRLVYPGPSGYGRCRACPETKRRVEVR